MKDYDQTLEVEITIDLVKGRNGGHRRSAAVPKAPDPPRVPRITRLMALAIKFQDMVDRGEVSDYADLARLGYVTRARLTQIMNLMLLAPDIQSSLMFREQNTARIEALNERALRMLTTEVSWTSQRTIWKQMLG